MLPFYFGDSAKPLFGIYSPANPACDRQKALLICPASFQDYMRSHRQLRQLAENLSRNGIHVLRFDYAGCGDSAGTWENSNVEEWINNIEQAASELQEISMVTNLTFLGVRLGASLLNLVNINNFSEKNYVLLDPIINGTQYLQTLETLQKELVVAGEGQFIVSRTSYLKDHELEYLGYPVTPETSGQIKSVNMLNEKCKANKVLLLHSHDEQAYKVYAKSNEQVELLRLSQSCYWESNEHIESQVQIPELPSIFKHFLKIDS